MDESTNHLNFRRASVTIPQLQLDLMAVGVGRCQHGPMQTVAGRMSEGETVAIVLVAVFAPVVVLVGLVIWIFVSVTTPAHFAVFKSEPTSCVVRGSNVLVEVRVTSRGIDGLYIERAHEVGASHATVSAHGRLPPGIGYSPGEVVPTAKQLRSTLETDGYYPPLHDQNLSPFLVRLHVTDPHARVRAIGVTVGAGEPEYYQELPINLVVASGRCSVR